MYSRNTGRWQKLYLAMAFEFARFYAPQIKRLQRLIYMSAIPMNDDAKIHFFYNMAKNIFKIEHKKTLNICLARGVL